MNQNSKIVFQNLRVSSHFLISFISSPLQQLPREETQPVSMFFGSSKSPWPSRQRPSLRYFPWAPSPAPLEQLVTIWKEYDSMITWYNDFMGFKRKTTLFEKLRENKVGIHIYMYIILICIHKRIHQKTGALDLLGPWLLIAVCVAGWLSELHLMIGIFPLIQKNDTHPTEHVPLLS